MERASYGNRWIKYVFKNFRAAVYKYQVLTVRTEISDLFIFAHEKPFGDLYTKITIKFSRDISLSRSRSRSQSQNRRRFESKSESGSLIQSQRRSGSNSSSQTLRPSQSASGSESVNRSESGKQSRR